ncbi:3-hydroxyacyl-CoA dehydrogenase family protein [Rhodoligotrophos defluvii]|uniref:3-hydroxyacyl-CoA dehydrogenase family protein n=1 Tax=Rhodoligotrophos defluvii TaxID=2561934 RepID=UPI0010CA1A6C|nr:3-hydroxyacyl-CoA dehydrogenase NAD-binding domain-containing protein [Rhodoligotrophos defluvii]
MTYHRQINTVAVVGLGLIGMSWVAYFLARGFKVQGFDPDPEASARTTAYVEKTWPALVALDLVAAQARREDLHISASLDEAIAGADFVQENAPELATVKASVLAEIGRYAPETVPIASSTSALKLTPLVASAPHPERYFLAHPFNPPHLVPLVEVSGGERTSPAVLDWAMWFYRHIRREPVRLKREIHGHIANRLQYVLYNEAARMVLEGVATAEDVDAAVSWGPGMRWALFGPFMTMHLGGGPGGIASAFNKFRDRDAFNTDRAARMVLTPEQEALFIEAVDRAMRGRTIQQLEADRDAALVELYRLKIRHASNATGDE